MLDFITAKGGRLTLAETYENAKNQNVVLRYTDVNEAQFETYRKSLLCDFTVYDEKSIVGNRFATLVNDTHELHICFYPSIGEMRVIYGARGWLPEKVAPVAEHIMTPGAPFLPMRLSDEVTEVTLIPYGHTQLRMTYLPFIPKK